MNTSAAPIKSLVAFPLPPDAYCAPDDPQRVGRNNLANFRVKVDGVPVASQWAHKAYLGDREVTTQLKLLGLSDRLAFDRDRTRSYCLDDDQGLGSINPVRRLMLRGSVWDLRASEARSTKPGRLMTSTAMDGDIDRACTDQGSARAVDVRVSELIRSPGAKAVYATLHDVEYILGTGRNWKGPITDFTLDVVKQAPTDIVSLCFPGRPQKVNELTLRFHHKNFLPPDKLQVNSYVLRLDR